MSLQNDLKYSLPTIIASVDLCMSGWRSESSVKFSSDLKSVIQIKAIYRKPVVAPDEDAIS